jgi:hypothetical protein
MKTIRDECKDAADEIAIVTRVWLECSPEKRPSPQALGQRIAEIAAAFATAKEDTDKVDCPCNADCSSMPNGPLYNCPYLPENARQRRSRYDCTDCRDGEKECTCGAPRS